MQKHGLPWALLARRHQQMPILLNGSMANSVLKSQFESICNCFAEPSCAQPVISLGFVNVSVPSASDEMIAKNLESFEKP
jgi:hypothetical protein